VLKYTYFSQTSTKAEIILKYYIFHM